LGIDQRVVHSALSEPERSGPLLYGATRSPILSARALEQLAEALARPEQHPIEVEARKPEVDADPLLVLLGDVEAEQQLAVAVGAQLADQAPHLLDLLLAHEGGELAGRGIGGIDGRRVDRVPLAAPRALAVAAEEQVASGAEEEAREPARLGDRAAAQPLEDHPEGLLVEVVGERRVAGQPPQMEQQAAAVARDQLVLGRPVAAPDAADEIDGHLGFGSFGDEHALPCLPSDAGETRPRFLVCQELRKSRSNRQAVAIDRSARI